MVTIFAEPQYDPDALLYINAVNGTGYALSTTEIQAINTFVSTLKSNGFWKRAGDVAIYPLAGNTADSQKFNLLNPVDVDSAYRLKYFNSPTHNANGIKGNGTNQYVDTLIPLNAMINTNMSGSVWMQEATSSGPIFGAENGSNVGLVCVPKYTVDNLFYYAVADDIGNGPLTVTSGKGFNLIGRINNTQKKAYQNGTLISTYTIPALSLTSKTIYLLARNLNGVIDLYSSSTGSFFSFLAGFTDTQALSYYNAVHALMVAFGRAV